jgi:Zn-dependent protease with chaperone function
MENEEIVKPGRADQLYERYAAVCKDMGVDTPPPLVIKDSKLINAFYNKPRSAFGAQWGEEKVTLTTGIIKLLDKQELEAVMAHEIGHKIDELKSLGQEKEKVADRHAAKALCNPEKLISALEKMNNYMRNDKDALGALISYGAGKGMEELSIKAVNALPDPALNALRGVIFKMADIHMELGMDPHPPVPTRAIEIRAIAVASPRKKGCEIN